METTAYNDLIELVPIPAGSFLMGSPSDEKGRYGDEGPQHEVTLGAFLLSRTPITQEQWRVVAGWPKVARELNPDPSYFKGPDRPVEQVSWDDAMEFCARLSQRTGRTYTLPSEAQWEYACRAGTTTPFAFGETLTPEMAHFDAGETSPVGSYPANAWGLQDMHGNVWEWCLDDWHDSYQDAPEDGRAWLEDDSLGKCCAVALGSTAPGSAAQQSLSTSLPRLSATPSGSESAPGGDSLGKPISCCAADPGTAESGAAARRSGTTSLPSMPTTPLASVSASASEDESLGKSSGAAVVTTTPGAAARGSAIATLPSFPTTSSDFAWSASSHKSVRGGPWYFNPGDCRSAIRDYFTSEYVFNAVGFRVARLPQDRMSQIYKSFANAFQALVLAVQR